MEYWYIVLRVDIYSWIYNTMAKIAMKDRKTVRIAEKPPPPPPPWGGCGVAGLGWCVSIMAVGYCSVSQSVRKASRNFRFSIHGRESAKGIWDFLASRSFAWCVRRQSSFQHREALNDARHITFATSLYRFGKRWIVIEKKYVNEL